MPDPQRPLPPSPASRGDDRDAYACPRCGARDLTRIPRHFLDRILALFVDVKRFRCTHIGCHWQGILRRRKRSARPPQPR